MADLLTGQYMTRRWGVSTLLLLALGASACTPYTSLLPTTPLPWCEEGPSYGTETATFDGYPWQPVRVAAPGLIGGPLEINASDCHREFNISFANNPVPGPGTYTLANGVNVMLANEPGNTGDNLILTSIPGSATAPGSATVTLTEVSSTTISGTFEITIGPHVLTNGRFDVRMP
jgi:hypothetical protein